MPRNKHTHEKKWGKKMKETKEISGEIQLSRNRGTKLNLKHKNY